MSSTAAPRRRRSSKDVRESILTVARELFDQNGYQATTTMQIAKAAGVSERLIFSNFGTKADLFNAAVVTPFAAVIGSYVERSVAATRNSSLEQRIDAFIRGLYDLAREHRTALLTALEATNSSERSPHDSVLDYLARSFQSALVVRPDEDFREDYDPDSSLAAFVGMVLGVALLDDLIFPSGERRPSRRRLIEEMRKTTMVGVSRHAVPDSRDGK